jgi:hypothetical protein
MALKEHFTKDAKVRFCDELLDEIEKYGFGSMLKTDQDALLYHLMVSNINYGVIKDRYSWIDLLRVKASKLNSVQETASVKYNKIEDSGKNWLLVCKQMEKHPPEVKDIESGQVRIYIDDAHIYRFMEWYLNQHGSSPEYQLNKTQLVVKYEMYLSFLETITKKVGIDTEGMEKALREDKSKGKITKTYNSASSLLSDLKDKVKETTIQEGTKALLEYAGTAIIGYAKKQIGE